MLLSSIAVAYCYCLLLLLRVIAIAIALGYCYSYCLGLRYCLLLLPIVKHGYCYCLLLLPIAYCLLLLECGMYFPGGLSHNPCECVMCFSTELSYNCENVEYRKVHSTFYIPWDCKKVLWKSTFYILHSWRLLNVSGKVARASLWCKNPSWELHR